MLLFFLAAFVGGVLGKYTKLPGGSLLGSTVAAAIVGILFDLPHSPPFFLIMLIQLLVGCMLGQVISRRFGQEILTIWRPCLSVVLLYTLFAVPFIAILARIFDFDVATALLAATPARMQDMIVLAGSLHSDAVTVMLLQLARQFVLLGITPFLLMRLTGEKTKGAATEKKNKAFRLPRFSRAAVAPYAMILVPGCIGAFFGHATGHVLGALLGAFCGVALSRVIWTRAGELSFPGPLGFIVQCLAGILIGARITPDIGGLIVDRLVPLVSACVYVILIGLVASLMLQRRYKWHRGLSWLASAPGRVSDMVAMSQDIELTKAERLALISVHAIRQLYFTLLVSVIMMFF